MGFTYRVAVGVELPGGEVIVIGVDTDTTGGQRGVERDGLDGWALPRGGHVPAVAVGVVMDTIRNGTVRSDAVGPLRPPMLERDGAGEDVPAMFGVRQVCERRGQFDADLTVRGDADRFVPESLARFPVRRQEHALGFPTVPPLPGGEMRFLQVVTGVDQALSSPYYAHTPSLPVRERGGMPDLKSGQTPGLAKPLAFGPVAARRPLGAVLPHRQGQAVSQRLDSGFQAVDVGGEAAAGERPLIMRALGDRSGPP
ncbi:hypothetical protein GCM10020000_34900 [Streptomyces olivoverticillatus]